jgi:DNA-binding transcriptional LysR family regulator
MDRLDAMHVFVAIVDAGSLSAAGRRLGIPLATISRKLADLEVHLKTRLVTRSTRHLALTDTGRCSVSPDPRAGRGRRAPCVGGACERAG